MYLLFIYIFIDVCYETWVSSVDKMCSYCHLCHYYTCTAGNKTNKYENWKNLHTNISPDKSNGLRNRVLWARPYPQTGLDHHHWAGRVHILDTHRLKWTLSSMERATCGLWCKVILYIDDSQTLTLLYAAVSATILLLLLLPHAAVTWLQEHNGQRSTDALQIMEKDRTKSHHSAIIIHFPSGIKLLASHRFQFMQKNKWLKSKIDGICFVRSDPVIQYSSLQNKRRQFWVVFFYLKIKGEERRYRRWWCLKPKGHADVY